MTENTYNRGKASFKEKQKKADDLLTGLIFHNTDLGNIGLDLVTLLLSSSKDNSFSKNNSHRLH